jgi:hypothetical protein
MMALWAVQAWQASCCLEREAIRIYEPLESGEVERYLPRQRVL